MTQGTEKEILCIYHGNCADGFSGAWVVSKFYGRDKVELFPAVYGHTPPLNLSGRKVVLVDFSYKADIILNMAEKAEALLLIDHHKTALELVPELEKSVKKNITLVLGMENSGSMLAWDYFFPKEEPPELLKHVEDRDLWRFALDGTREVQACLFSYPYTLDVWDKLMTDYSCADLYKEGVAIERKHHKDIAELLPVLMTELVIGGMKVKAANLPYTMSSDAGHLLCTKYEQLFGACYYLTDIGVVFSLRSTDAGPDVSEIAKAYGGGGHRNAAGFRVSLDEFTKMKQIYQQAEA